FGRKFPIQAIRHVLTPTVSFNYTPDFGDEKWGYHKSYYDPKLDKEVKYSVFEGGIYGSPPGAKSSSMNFSLANNLEMKVRSLKDTVTGTKKITLIDNFTVSTSYDMAKDSLKWSDIRMSGRTRLYKGVDITYSSAWDLYAVDSNGTNINKFEWDVNRRLMRLKNTSWNIGASLRMDPDFFKSEADKKKDQKDKTSANATQDDVDYIKQNPDDYIDWEIPWSVNINYNLRWSMTHRMTNGSMVEDEQLVQTLGFSGDVSITPKWKIGIMTGWDFDANALSYTSVNIYRDLHCFEMRFNWIPIGPRKSWNFGLNVKASILQDMKLSKKKDFRDI
ncbi:putative LPS assembly protein LptD, partial [Bacteroidota bacterium]